jgi:cell wall-associated NlpC family hydrolase
MSARQGGDAVNGKRRFVTVSVLFGTLLLSLALTSSALASPVSSKKAELARVQARLETVYQQVDMAVEKYNQATTQLHGVKDQIKRNGHLLKVAEYNLGIANEQLTARALDIYKTRDVSVVDVLFSASDFDDLVTQLDLMERLGNSDVDTVTSIKDYRQEIKDRRVKLDADKKAATALVAKAADNKAEVESLQGKLEQMTAGIKADIKRIQAAAAARAEAAAEAAAGQSGGGTSTGGGGGGTVVDPGGSGHSAVVAIAQRYIGVPYVYGGASPSGFDCSGLAMYCYAQIGIGLSHGATDQQHSSTPVPLNALQPGDLVFFGSASYSHHVGIYVGGGSMIHAPHTGAVVGYGSISGAWIGGRP